jgi:serine protease
MGGMPASATIRAAIAAAFLAAACLAGATALAPAAPAAASEQAATGRAIVEVASPPIPATAETHSPRWRRLRAEAGALLTRLAERNDLDVADRIPQTGQLTVALDRDERIADLRGRLAEDPRVTRITADRPIEVRLSPNDPGFTAVDANAPGSDFRQWNLSRLFAPQAWDLSDASGREVAVIDLGTDVTHPDFNGRISGALDCTGGCSGTNVFSSNGHGTHVAGLACAVTNNGYGIASAGFGCNLFPIRIGFCSEAAGAIVAAADRGSDAINMSFGGCGAELNNELTYALGRGSVPVAAADNVPNPNPNTNHPAQFIQPVGTGSTASFNRGLVVTAATHSGARASWAQQDTGVSVAAFGSATDATGGQQGILSTWPNVACNPNCRTSVAGDSRFAYLQGTSMAAPQVAGVVALMRKVNSSLPPAEVANLIKQTASHCGSYGNGLGWGTVNAYRAVIAAGKLDRVAPVSRVKKAFPRKLKLKSRDAGGSACQLAIPASGVKTVYLYVAPKKSDRYRLIGATKKDVWRFKRKRKKEGFDFMPKRGKRYRFFSVAVDEAGNAEASPPKSDERLGRKSRKRGRR